ncbi:hypothetical protein I8H89_05125 [Candidatus Saccharibacteria bacterium]|nr:hypothetical protein [Candidatus Saccharibacteria bacterium]
MSSSDDHTVSVGQDWVRLAAYAKRHKISVEEAMRRILQRVLDEDDRKRGRAVPARPTGNHFTR